MIPEPPDKNRPAKFTAAVTVAAGQVRQARWTVNSLALVAPHVACQVLDLDGEYRPIATERVFHVDDPALAASLTPAELRLTHDPAQFDAAIRTLWAADRFAASESGTAVLAVAPGVVFLRDPEILWLSNRGAGVTFALTTAADLPPGAPGPLNTDLYLLGPGAAGSLGRLRGLARNWDTAVRAVEAYFAGVPHAVISDDAVFVSRSNSGPETIFGHDDDEGFPDLTLGGEPVLALDLAGWDPEVGPLFDSRGAPWMTGPLLSRNPGLVIVVAELTRPKWFGRNKGAPEETAPDAEFRREIARGAVRRGDNVAAAAAAERAWLLELVPARDRHPVARYLMEIWEARADLRDAFPGVPGRDSAAFANWALANIEGERAFDAGMLRRAAELTLAGQRDYPVAAEGVRSHGVNLVGYLSGELGVGTSARLMDEALTAAGVPTSTYPVTILLGHRAGAVYRDTADVPYDTTLFCVNPPEMEPVTESLFDLVAGTRRIGMWYWEVEAYPACFDVAFELVDEIWVATEFIRDAIAAHTNLPVRVVMPPLPQREPAGPPPLPSWLGIPDGSRYFFYAFDYFSRVERKNPEGLLRAFSEAFAPGEGPLLVLKTINAAARPAESERLRLLAAGRPDVIVIDQYVSAAEMTALMAHCTAYVSLHRAEGLGLTIAEAMAWGRPVVVSAYSGNLAFCNSENSFLVSGTMTPIPAGNAPYPTGTPWFDPDLSVAARYLREIVEQPEVARAVGERAAQDLAELHNPAVAGAAVANALTQPSFRTQPSLGA